MTDHTPIASPRLQARIVGFIYLTIIVLAAFGYGTHSLLFEPSDAAATAGNILAAERSWRTSIAAMLVMISGDVAVASIFYVLFKPVNRTLSLIGFAFRLVLVAIFGVAILGRYAPLLLLQEPTVSTLGIDQVQSLSVLSIKLFERGFEFALVFFGFHCLVIGWLIFRSSFLPQLLGVLLMIAGLLYLTDSFRILVFPTVVAPFDILLLSYAAELALAMWLLVIGVNAERWNEQASAA